MIINNIIKATILYIVFFTADGIFAQDSFLLSCKGKRWSEVNLQKFEITEYTQSYEIRAQQLLIPVAHSKSVAIDPTNFGEHEIFYYVKRYPRYDFIKDYYLTFDRISGSFLEQYDSSVGKKVDGFAFLQKFQETCEKTKDKKF